MAADLTSDFVLNFVEDQLPPDAEPVLQIIEMRRIQNVNTQGIAYRVRLSDGQFSYSAGGFADHLSNQIVQDGLDDVSKKAIIRIKELKRMQNPTTDKPTLSIISYELVRKLDQIVGNPIPYKNRDSFAGYREARERQRENIQPNPYNVAVAAATARKRPADTTSSGVNIVPLKMLTPYLNKWRIQGIVKGKEDMKDIKTVRGPSKILKFNIMDKDGVLIGVTGFGEHAERFNPIVHNGQCIYLSGPGGNQVVKSANKKFNSTGLEYEIMLNKDCEIQMCQELLKPKLNYSFKPLLKIHEFSGENIDVLAIVDKVEEAQKINTKNGETNRRRLYLVDQSGTMVELTLWGNQCDDYDVHSEGEVLAFKGASVREFNGSYSLSIYGSTLIERDLDDSRADELRRWYENERPNANLKSMSGGDTTGQNLERELRLIGVISSNNQTGRSEKGDYFNVVALISTIKGDQAIYKACVTDNCRKKLVPLDNNQFRCEKCDVTTPNYKYNLILSMELADLSGTHWATIFEDTAVKLLGRGAQELGKLQEDDLDTYNGVFDAVRFRTYNCRIRAKSQIFNDQEQIKWTIYDMKPVQYDLYNKYLKKSIEKLDEAAMDDDW